MSATWNFTNTKLAVDDAASHKGAKIRARCAPDLLR
jgi:hypothetical protein